MAIRYYITVFLQISLLLTLSLAIVILSKSPALIRAAKQSDFLVVELKDEPLSEGRDRIRDFLISSSYLVSNSLEYYSKDDALGILDMKQLSGNENPFRNIFLAELNAEGVEKFSVLEKQLMAQPGVHQIFHEEAIGQAVKGNLRKIGWVCIFLSVFLMFTILMIKYFLIQLRLKAGAREQRMLQLAGADDSFIIKPVLKDNGKEYAITSLVAILLSLLIIRWYNSIFDGQLSISNGESLIICLAVAIIGAIIPFGFIYFALNQYLKKSLNS